MRNRRPSACASARSGSPSSAGWGRAVRSPSSSSSHSPPSRSRASCSPAYPGRDMNRYIQAFVQLFYETRSARRSSIRAGRSRRSAWASRSSSAAGRPRRGWRSSTRVRSSPGPRSRTPSAPGGDRHERVPARVPRLRHPLPRAGERCAVRGRFRRLVAAAALGDPEAVRADFLALGAGMGLLVLVRPVNQVLIVFVLLPLLLRGSLARAALLGGGVLRALGRAHTGLKLLNELRYGDAVELEPSAAVLVTALVLLPFLLPLRGRRQVAGLAGLALACAAAVVVVGGGAENPSATSRGPLRCRPARSSSTAPSWWRRSWTDNGPASRRLARRCAATLLAEEPYRSYGVDLDEFFSSGSNRVFGDMGPLRRRPLRRDTRGDSRASGRLFGHRSHLLGARLEYANVCAPCRSQHERRRRRGRGGGGDRQRAAPAPADGGRADPGVALRPDFWT